MSSGAAHRRGPGYHDPTFEVGGAAPARSALTLRLVLAVFGLVVFAGCAVLFWVTDAPTWITVGAVFFAATAVVDIIVVGRRKRAGEPG